MAIEVLSPVGNEEMLKAAVRSGADAVYLGTDGFNARRNAENFSKDGLKKAIEYCHMFGVKVYLTLNILIKDTELESAFCVAKDAYNMGIDGVIIADLGLIGILHNKIPELPLHASTQMSVFSPPALYPLKKLGIKRVVAAREMSKTQLKDLINTANALNMEVEVFVHGALCMCMSGQCLLSAFLGSRSGNRGLCAGPCRLPFKAENGDGYDLSLKDLSLIKHIEELKNMGVASLKIEGRMKRPEYVAAATYNVKQAVVNGRCDPDALSLLEGVFSRSGFTDGYFTGNLSKDMFGIRTKENVLLSESVLPDIHNLYKSEPQNIGISLSFSAKASSPCKLTLSDKTNTVTVTGDIPSPAVNMPITEDFIKEKLSKTGGTPYFVETVFTDVDENLYLSVSSLNDLRRRGIEELNNKRKRTVFSSADFPKKATLKVKREEQYILRLNNINQLPDNLNGVFGISLPIESDIPPDLDLDVTLFADIPRAADENFVKSRLSELKKLGFTYALCGNLSSAETAGKLGFKIAFSLGSNIYNSESIDVLSRLYNADIFILSPELTANEIGRVNTDKKTGYISYGRIPLMLFAVCPEKSHAGCESCNKKGYITDRLGLSFPLRCRAGFSEMLNSKPIWTADKSDGFSADFSLLYFTDEDKETVKKILDKYKNREKCDADFTRGLYYRGVE